MRDFHRAASFAASLPRFASIAVGALVASLAMAAPASACAPGSYFDGLSCVECGNGGATYQCSAGEFLSGTACDGSGSEDTQTCQPCNACPDGTYESLSCDGTSSSDVRQCTECTLCGELEVETRACAGTENRLCELCGGGIVCDPGEFAAPVGNPCEPGGSWTCVACSNGGTEYHCSTGEYQSGSACDGNGFSDTQTCSACSCPGSSYLVTPCSGNTTTDTSVCSACTQCSDGEYATAECSATSDRSCAACGNGGVAYDCASGQYRSGTACLGNASSSDTQTCAACGRGGADYDCVTGEYRIGTACDGHGTSDTQTCDTCANFGASYFCGADGYRTGDACTGDSSTDTQTCSACGTCATEEYETASCVGNTSSDDHVCEACTQCVPGQYQSRACGPYEDRLCDACGNGGADYDCDPGEYRSGSACNGNSSTSDTQACSQCDNGGAAYGCEAGEYISGSACDGDSSSDTQTCTGCVLDCPDDFYMSGCPGTTTSDVRVCTECSPCAPGYFASSPCGGASDRVCTECGNGGADYQCGAGQYPTGTACAGQPTDTQTCGTVGEGCVGASGQACASCFDGNAHVSGPACVCDAGYFDSNPDTDFDGLTCNACTVCAPDEFTSSTCALTADAECEPCDSSCATCTGPDADECASCDSGAVPLDGYCLDDGECAPEPASCALASGGSLSVKYDSDSSKNRLKWKWKGGLVAAGQSSYGDPVALSGSYQLCIYGDAGPVRLLARAAIPTLGTCDGNPCWAAVSDKGWQFKSRDGASSGGVTKMKLMGGKAGKPAIQAGARGIELSAPLSGTLYVNAAPVTAQLRLNGSTSCWSSTFDAADFDLNEGGKLKAKQP